MSSALPALAVLAGLLAYPLPGTALTPEQSEDRLAAAALEEAPARGKFLIASRDLVEPTFARRVVLLLDHDEMSGGIGLIVNRPSRIPLAQVVPGLEQFTTREDYIRSGGPVERNRLFLLMRADVRPSGTEQVLADTYGSSTLGPLRNLMVSGEAESASFIVYAGYAGWAPGQLEAEIERGDWHVAPGRSEHVFDTDATEVWPRLIRLHGGKWVDGSSPASGFARLIPTFRPVQIPCGGGDAQHGTLRAGRCAPFRRARGSLFEGTGPALQGLKLSKIFSFPGPVTTYQYQSPSRASLLPGT